MDDLEAIPTGVADYLSAGARHVLPLIVGTIGRPVARVSLAGVVPNGGAELVAPHAAPEELRVHLAIRGAETVEVDHLQRAGERREALVRPFGGRQDCTGESLDA